VGRADGDRLGFGWRQGRGIAKTLLAFILVGLAITRRRRRWWWAYATLPFLAARNDTEEGFANPVDEGRRTG